MDYTGFNLQTVFNFMNITKYLLWCYDYLDLKTKVLNYVNELLIIFNSFFFFYFNSKLTINI